MAATAGYNGNVTVGTHVIAQIKSNQFDMQRAIDDITSMLATPTGFKVFLPTLAEMVFSFTANWDMTDTLGQLAIQTAWLNATLLTFIVTPNGGTNTYTFSGYVKKIGNKFDVSKVNETQIDIQPTGAPTIV
jgi:hypothetical protein